MVFSNEDDVRRCIKIVNNELVKSNINVNDEILNKITIDVMNISYSKGGDYSGNVIQSFAETYIEEGFYKKFLNLNAN